MNSIFFFPFTFRTKKSPGPVLLEPTVAILSSYVYEEGSEKPPKYPRRAVPDEILVADRISHLKQK